MSQTEVTETRTLTGSELNKVEEMLNESMSPPPLRRAPFDYPKQISMPSRV